MLKDLFQQSARMVANTVYVPKKLRDLLPTTTNGSGMTVIDSKVLMRLETVVTKLDFNKLTESLKEHDQKVLVVKEKLKNNYGEGFKVNSIKRKRLDKYYMVVTTIRYNI